MPRFSLHSSGYARLLLVVALALIVAATVLLAVNRSHTARVSTHQANLGSRCVGQTFASGSSGHCVRGIQTLVNYMEHSGLTECPFPGGATLPVNGMYDTATARQVLAVQHWASCYAAQEGFTSNVKQTGIADKTTWGELCTYGYTDPLRSHSSSASTSIAAGADAGCALLQH